MPKELAEKFNQYEMQANAHREELKELAEEVVALQSQNLAVCQFCAECLVSMYKKVTTHDAKTTKALCLILTMHWDKSCLNINLCEAIHWLEALVSQPLVPLPPSTNPNNDHSNAEGAKSTPLTTDIPPTIESLKKRGKSGSPDDVDSAPKQQKL